MSARVLPVITESELQTHATRASCYVALGSRVFDVTSFLEDHPGGGDLILSYAGRDVGEVLQDEISHLHSEAAYEVLDDHLVGRLELEPTLATSKPAKDFADVKLGGQADANVEPSLVPNTTGVSSAEDLSVETDVSKDYGTHKFLDLNRPLLMQVWNGGFSKEFYLAQVHRPRHYKSGQSAPLFGNFLEPLSKTPWWIIPTFWLPPVIYGTYIAKEGMSSWAQVAAYWLVGLAIWTMVEYGLHRGLFHIDGYLPDNRVAITVHFLLHGIHHYLPMDKLRLVMPPTLFIVLAIPFWKLAHVLFFWNWHVATAVFCGGLFGYVCYDCTHYFLHHRTLPAYYRELKKYHLQHHFMDYQNGFGVTNRFWDRVFGTELCPPKATRAV